MIWVIFLLPVLTFAQVDIFGYYESEYDYLQLQNSDYNFGYNKLRLDLESRSSDQVMIAGNINFQLPYGKIEWDFFDFIPVDTVEFDGEEITSFPKSFWLAEMTRTSTLTALSEPKGCISPSCSTRNSLC